MCLKVAAVEAEAQNLRDTIISKQTVIKQLERRVALLESENLELIAKVHDQ